MYMFKNASYYAVVVLSLIANSLVNAAECFILCLQSI